MSVYRLRERSTGMWMTINGSGHWVAVPRSEKALHWRRYGEAEAVADALKRSEGIELEVVEGTR